MTNPFHFKQFSIFQEKSTMKVGTDGILLGAWAGSADAKVVLDIGAGSGLITLMLAQRVADANIHGVEIEEESFLQAQENIKKSPWANRVEVHHISIQDFAKESNLSFDLIVSNPPFFSGGTFSDSNQRNNVRHTVKLPHGDLLLSVRRLLAKDGRFCLILPYIEGLRFCEIAETYNLFCVKSQEVLPKMDKPVERLLMEFTTVKPNECQKLKPLVIQKGVVNDWTDDFIDLTKDFYLKM